MLRAQLSMTLVWTHWFNYERGCRPRRWRHGRRWARLGCWKSFIRFSSSSESQPICDQTTVLSSLPATSWPGSRRSASKRSRSIPEARGKMNTTNASMEPWAARCEMPNGSRLQGGLRSPSTNISDNKPNSAVSGLEYATASYRNPNQTWHATWGLDSQTEISKIMIYLDKL